MLLEQLRRSWYDSNPAYARVAITGSPRYGRAPNALSIAVLFESRFRLVWISSMVLQHREVVVVEVLRMYPLVILVLVAFPPHQILGTRLTSPSPAPRIYDLRHHPLGVAVIHHLWGRRWNLFPRGQLIPLVRDQHGNMEHGVYPSQLLWEL
jgi:hypothetical protein